MVVIDIYRWYSIDVPKMYLNGNRMAYLKEVEIKKYIDAGVIKEYPDTPNLYLCTTKAKTGYWEVNRSVDKKRKKCRFGKYPEISSKTARELAPIIYDALQDNEPKNIKAICAINQDPSKLRSFFSGEIATVKKVAPTFQEYAIKWWKENIQPSDLDAKTIRQKIQQLESYVFPKIGYKPLNQISYDDIKQIVLPMWNKRGERGGDKAGHETATRILGIVREVFRNALNDRQNTLLDFNPTPTSRDMPKVMVKVQHNVGVPFERANEFWTWLMEVNTSSLITKTATAVGFLLGKRTKQIRFLKWVYIDLDKAIYYSPARHFNPEIGKEENYTKNRQEYYTPIPKRLNAMLAEIKPLTEQNYYALSMHPTKPLSNNTISDCVAKFDYKDADGRCLNGHGVRSTFDNFVEEVIKPREGIAKKLLLQHKLNTLELSYFYRPEQRVPLESELREYIQQWEDYVVGNR